MGIGLADGLKAAGAKVTVASLDGKEIKGFALAGEDRKFHWATAQVTPQGITLQSQRTIFKGGTFKITMALKGFELTSAQASMLNDPTVQSMLSGCGCGVYRQG